MSPSTIQLEDGRILKVVQTPQGLVIRAEMDPITGKVFVETTAVEIRTFLIPFVTRSSPNEFVYYAPYSDLGSELTFCFTVVSPGFYPSGSSTFTPDYYFRSAYCGADEKYYQEKIQKTDGSVILRKEGYFENPAIDTDDTYIYHAYQSRPESKYWLIKQDFDLNIITTLEVPQIPFGLATDDSFVYTIEPTSSFSSYYIRKRSKTFSLISELFRNIPISTVATAKVDSEYLFLNLVHTGAYNSILEKRNKSDLSLISSVSYPNYYYHRLFYDRNTLTSLAYSVSLNKFEWIVRKKSDLSIIKRVFLANRGSFSDNSFYGGSNFYSVYE